MIIFIPGKAKPNHGKILNKKGSGEAGPKKSTVIMLTYS